jgi:D-alanine-D-alanine ligase
MTRHIVVLKGGLSKEREVSLASGTAVEIALRELGYRVSGVDAGARLAAALEELKPDAVFNALHGQYGEDGCVQGVLELLGIPYTHSGVLASALAMDKPQAKKIFEAEGLRCAEGGVFTRAELCADDPMPRPYVVKPLNEGSSVGVRIVQPGEAIPAFSEANWPFERDVVLVERYIPGREIQVAVLDGEALGVIEIRPQSGFYDYEAKYTAGKAAHLMPAPLPEAEYAEVCRMAEQAHRALGCRGLTRSDFRYNDQDLGEGLFYILETNTQPGMTPLSLAPEIAAHRGMSFGALVERLIASATTDHGRRAAWLA